MTWEAAGRTAGTPFYTEDELYSVAMIANGLSVIWEEEVIGRDRMKGQQTRWGGKETLRQRRRGRPLPRAHLTGEGATEKQAPPLLREQQACFQLRFWLYSIMRKT